MGRMAKLILGGLFLLTVLSYIIYDRIKMINEEVKEKEKGGNEKSNN